MIRWYLVAILMLFVLRSTAQNLVPNPGFETYTSCPTFASQLNLAAPWFNASSGTPEYFNACALPSSWVSVPGSPTGHYQYPHGGNGYAGIFTYNQNVADFREYIEVPLLSPMQNGKQYYFEMWVNSGNDHEFAADGIGAWFNLGAYATASPWVMPIQPQISNTNGNILSDTLNWVKISGCFMSAGWEDHIIIGNFKDDAATSTQQVNPNAWYTGSAYLYIDDVLLVPFEEVDLGNDTVICQPQSFVLDATSTIPGVTYLWQDSSTGPAFTATQSGIYWVEVRVGNCMVTDSITITLGQPAAADLLGTDTVVCLPEPYILDASYPGGSYTWSTGETTPAIETASTGTYSVEVSTPCGSIYDTVTVTFAPCECYLYVPNTFTPDDDGVNDRFGAVHDCAMKEVLFTVYDRWGHAVFRATDISAMWDGKVNGRIPPVGVYAWTLEYMGHGATGWGHYRQKGNVLLLK